MTKGNMHPAHSKAIRMAGGSSPHLRRHGYDDGGAAGADGSTGDGGGAAGAGDGNPMFQPQPAPPPVEAPIAKKGPEADEPFPYASSVPNWMGGTKIPVPPKIARSGGRARRK